MQPCGREMQAMNSHSDLPLASQHSQIQLHPPHFDSSQHDDFLDQMMLSSLPSSSSWTDLKSSWPPSSDHENGAFQFDDSAILASKLCHHQISSDDSPDTAAAKMMLQQQLLLSLGAGSGFSAIDGSSVDKSHMHEGEYSGQAPFNGFAGAMLGGGPTTLNQNQGQSYGGAAAAAINQAPAASGAPAQSKQRVRARRGQATDPHSIAERLRRERIAERMKSLQELVPNANKTDKASMLDEIIDYVKFLQLQVKVLSMSRLGGAGGRLGGMSRGGEGKGDRETALSNNHDSLKVTEGQVVKLMEEDMGSAMQYLQGKGLCLMPISLATAISTSTKNPFITTLSNADASPSSPSVSALTVQSTTTTPKGKVSTADASPMDATDLTVQRLTANTT